MRPTPHSWVTSIGLVAVTLLGSSAATAQEASDPFALLRGLDARSAALVPPRALAVIPERHTGRMVQMVDVLIAIDPQFDDVASGAGLDGRRAIQLRTREARVPIFVAKTEATVATLLQIPMGARIEVRGILLRRGTHYIFLAAEVRPAPRRPRRRR